MGLAATVDSAARPGAMAFLGGSLGMEIRDHHSVIGTATLDGGVIDPRPVAGVLRGALSVEWLGEWRKIAGRAGPSIGLGGQFGYNGQLLGAFGARAAVLAVVHRRETADTGGCGPHTDLGFYGLGVAAFGDYQVGPDRALFGVGPSFEYYKLERGCD